MRAKELNNSAKDARVWSEKKKKAISFKLLTFSL